MNNIELVEHQEHDPSLCDFARIWLVKQWQANTHMPIINKLTAEQLVLIGYKSCIYSLDASNTDLYAGYDITLDELFDFSEFVRLYLIQQIAVEYVLGMGSDKKAHLN